MKQIIGALLILAGIALAQPNSNWGTSITAVQMPTTAWESGTSCGIRSIASDASGYHWIGGCAGIFKALATDIASAPSSVRTNGKWVNVSSGQPLNIAGSTCGTVSAPRDMVEYSGTMYATFSDPCNNANGSYFGKWNGSSWVTYDYFNATGTHAESFTRLDVDKTTGNIYVGGSGGSVLQSTNGGTSFSVLTSYTALGYGGGNVFGLSVLYGPSHRPEIWFGGESPVLQYVISGGANCNVLSGDNGSPSASKTLVQDGCTTINSHQYAHNDRCHASDGTATSAYTYVMACEDDITAGTGSNLQRYNAATHTWSRPSSATIPSPGSGTTDGLFYFWIRPGTTSNEWYIPTGGNGAWNLIIGSVDGGQTWQSVGGTIAACANNACKFAMLGISPVDDSKLTASNGNGTFAPYLYFHPSPSTAPTITTTSPLPNGTVNVAYTQTLTATGTPSTMTWTCPATCTMPGWMSLSSGGVLSGTPLSGGTFTFTVKASNGVNPDATKSFSVTVPTPGASSSSIGLRTGTTIIH